MTRGESCIPNGENVAAVVVVVVAAAAVAVAEAGGVAVAGNARHGH